MNSVFSNKTGYEIHKLHDEEAFKDFINKYESDYLLEYKLLKLQYNMDETFSKFSEPKLNHIEKILKKHIVAVLPSKSFAEIQIRSLSSLNIWYLDSAFQSLGKDIIHVFANVLRTAYESFPKLLYMIDNPNDISYILFHDHLDYECNKEWRRQKKDGKIIIPKEEFYSEYKMAFLKENKKEIFTHDVTINDQNLIIKFNTALFLKNIFPEKEQYQWRLEYGDLSITSHPNYARVSVGSILDKINRQEYLNFLIGNTFLNGLILLNTCPDELYNTSKINDMKNILKKTYPRIMNKHYEPNSPIKYCIKKYYEKCFPNSIQSPNVFP